MRVKESVASATGDRLSLRLADAQLTGLDRDALAAGGRGVAAIRPEDLDVAEENAGGRIPACIEVVEYHGRELAVQARLSDGQRVHFRTGGRLAPGDRVDLAAAPERVLVFAPEGERPPEPVNARGEPAAAVPRPPLRRRCRCARVWVPGTPAVRISCDRNGVNGPWDTRR
ncbi:TOBE domain-containing protein [Streptomyces sp. NBC_01210]|uniref:TOBE domain-containing protein n=1 Tax=Streptomyces sp. NBC_01210 TaxID=2903774 RepID=UPI002E12FA6E|nr:TOBE domain-containing protein [Streptomyces sp. NBC_01210]